MHKFSMNYDKLRKIKKTLGLVFLCAMTGCGAKEASVKEVNVENVVGSMEENVKENALDATQETILETTESSAEVIEETKEEITEESIEENTVEENIEETIVEIIEESEEETATVETNTEGQGMEVKRDENMFDDPVTFAANMGLGWNLGNTLDATDGFGLESEISWGMPYTTKELIDYIKECGFTTIRIPTSWSKHMDANGIVDAAWMNRVKQVVDWALEDDFIVILNTHHDNDSYYPTDTHLEQSKQYLSAVWAQIAGEFKDYDQRLVFEAMNEPRLSGTDIEWWFQSSDERGCDAIRCVVELNQFFVDLIRRSGGNNGERFLMVPSVCASPDNAFNSNFSMPVDPAEKMILSVHAYTPYDFTMNDNGYSNWDASKKGEMNFLKKLKTQFIDKGYGVVVGEFGATNKDNIDARVAWARDYMGTANSLGIPCVLWDNGLTKIGNENFGMIDRNNLKVYYPQLLEALLNP